MIEVWYPESKASIVPDISQSCSVSLVRSNPCFAFRTRNQVKFSQAELYMGFDA